MTKGQNNHHHQPSEQVKPCIHARLQLSAHQSPPAARDIRTAYRQRRKRRQRTWRKLAPLSRAVKTTLPRSAPTGSAYPGLSLIERGMLGVSTTNGATEWRAAGR